MILTYSYPNLFSNPARIGTARNRMSVTTKRIGQPRRMVCASGNSEHTAISFKALQSDTCDTLFTPLHIFELHMLLPRSARTALAVSCHWAMCPELWDTFGLCRTPIQSLPGLPMFSGELAPNKTRRIEHKSNCASSYGTHEVQI